MNIQSLKIEDVPTIVAVHRDCVDKSNSTMYPADVITEWLSQITTQSVHNQLNNSSWYVIRENRTIIGFCQYNLEDEELYQIQIDPEYQGKGYGKSLYKFVENDFRKHNKQKISLNSTVNAAPFYEKRGFKKAGDLIFPLHLAEIRMIRMEKEIQ